MVMEMDDEEPVDEDIEIIEEEGKLTANSSQGNKLQLSMNTLSGASTYQTMRVSGLYNKKMLLQILIDSGSTHNFLDLDLAKKLGCKLEAIAPLAVTVANSTRLEALYVCKGFSW